MSALDPTPAEHEHSAAVDQAAAWLRSLRDYEKPQPIVPALRDRFGLSPVEACQAIAEARR
ncbi:hypothetical protein [Hoeflea sp.]|uniref:hypothetical protein n=1 Tax=Hoeflea sp. TaxID=1940281 RepID=UPI0025BC868F|nr:hypothetical protein [Hoeflea sp.]MBU4529189.1 hypothetical protein [Alphaproteobacteria bacterium]MBU4549219.1 hypothetical protein [Alphaproteobacteria bacterium]MBV1785315.1 hypothetical protein [Hoeflea sp.]